MSPRPMSFTKPPMKMIAAGRTDETVLVAPLNLAEARAFRAGMGFFRDRRPDLYGPLLTRDGKTRP